MVQIPLTADSEITAFGRDLGAGTALPTQGPAATALRRGDAFYHSSFGALFLWNGTAWRSRGPGELTKAQRLALATASIPYAGFQVYETDTGRTWQWTGTLWSLILGPRPYFMAYGASAGGAAQNIPLNAWTEVQFAGYELADTDNAHDLAASYPTNTRFVAPLDGYYRVCGNVAATAPGASGAVLLAAAIGTNGRDNGGRSNFAATSGVGGYGSVIGSGTSKEYATASLTPSLVTNPRRVYLAAGQLLSLWTYMSYGGISAISPAGLDQATSLEVTFDGSV